VLTLQPQVDVAFHGATPPSDRDHGTITKNPRVVELDLPPAERRAPRFRDKGHDLPASGQHRGPHSR
jgi:hypothetical protein